MPEIGETLRETRMRRRIDMTEVEAATKIRAKYLRALENEEWDLLPGPTFVKTFLRTYAEYLDLDPRLLVEEYRQRFERPTTQDLTPFRRERPGRQRQRARRPIGPFVVVGLAILIVLGALYILGQQGPDEEEPNVVSTPTATPTATAAPTETASGSKRKKKRGPARVSLKLTATDRVYVCLVDATGKAVVNGEYIEKGRSTRTFRSKFFRVNLGNSSVRMSYGGKRYGAANIGQPIGYELRPGKRPKRLKESVRTGLCAT
ncbi:helix-turn-helix domain-containing protein [Solirubrobacter sp. CPCC 204708]|uniref:Helix-turn-helix domain-containing protein n=1 Tax=Solirubrobacter deserti TaxID=2282478 RepID=A0ABT4RH20_9ACTN|nr:helix-turn-helix domain-containing protein [Solirubrobacter deserti]MBE2315326.1 helix-turn-helix domain-containing protein [Solirubrobacter deserti]MDA0137829.1 helix-turn-helix domain-containing protein [Solirubrobacter deserti]